MPPPIGFSRARETLSDLVTDAVRSHRPISIKRRDELAVLIGAADLDGILAAYEFRPEVFFEDDAVSIWLPEFILYGRGRTYDCAVEDLVEEVRAYVDDYLERSVAYLNAPNRSG
jgi:hypothetical protein